MRIAGRIAAGLVVAAALAPSPARAEPHDPTRALTFELRLDRRFWEERAASREEFDQRQPASTLTIDLPPTDPAVEKVLAGGDEQERRRALAEAIEATRIGSEYEAQSLATMAASVPVSEIEQDRARMRWRLRERGPWEIEGNPDCQVSAHPFPSASRVPAGSRLRLQVDFVGSRPGLATPRPTRVAGSTVAWDFAGYTRAVEKVCTTPEPALTLPQNPEDRATRDKLWDVFVTLLLALPTTVLFLVGLRWTIGRRRRPRLALERIWPTLMRSRGLAGAALWLVAGLVVARVLQSAWLAFGFGNSLDVERVTGAATTAISAGCSLVGLALCARSVRSIRGRWHVGWRALAVLLAIALLCVLPFAAIADTGLLADPTVRCALLVGGVLVVVAAAFVVIGTTWRAFMAAIPPAWEGTVLKRFTRKYQVRVARLLVVAMIGLAVWRELDEVQRSLSFGSTTTPWKELLDEGFLFENLARWPGELVTGLVQAAVYLLPLAVGVAAARGLVEQHGWTHTPSAVEERVLALLFAGGVAVTGTLSINILPPAIEARAPGSPLASFFLPLVLFASAYATVRVLLNVRAGQARTAGLGERGALLRAEATRQAAWQTQRAEYTLFASGKTTPGTYFGPRPEEPPDDDRTGLEAGPRPSWQANARLALRRGVLVALIPLAYVAWSFLSRLPPVLSPAATYAPAYFVNDLVSELLFWLTVALTLGALWAFLPGRNGLFKAGSTALIVVIPHLVAAILVPGRERVASWLFIAAEVLVFATVVAVTLDLATIRPHRIYWRHLLDTYRVRSLQAALAYGIPLLVSIGVIIDHLVSGRTGDAAAELAKTAAGIR